MNQSVPSMPEEESVGARLSDPCFTGGLRLVIGLNLTYFVVELIVAVAIGSVSLVADSVDFLEDSAVSGLILVGLRFGALGRARLGMGLSALLLLPASAGFVMLLHKIAAPVPPEPLSLSVTGLGALLVNGICALILARVRGHAGSLSKAAFLSARNDVLANLAIIGAAGVTAFWPSIWPDIVVGLGIALLNADAAREIFAAAQQEHRDAQAR